MRNSRHMNESRSLRVNPRTLLQEMAHVSFLCAVCDMWISHELYVWIPVPSCRKRNATYSYVKFVTRSYMGFVTYLYVLASWPTHMWNMTHSYVRFVTQSHVESFLICMTSHLDAFLCESSHSYVKFVTHSHVEFVHYLCVLASLTHSYVQHDSVGSSWYIHTWSSWLINNFSLLTRCGACLIRMCSSRRIHKWSSGLICMLLPWHIYLSSWRIHLLLPCRVRESCLYDCYIQSPASRK